LVSIGAWPNLSVDQLCVLPRVAERRLVASGADRDSVCLCVPSYFWAPRETYVNCTVPPP